MECCVDRLSSPPERGHRLSAFGMSGLARRIFTLQHWSAQPCVRPVCAVRMTAGHNALRGSGPGQQHAFEDAVAHVGCPDRRIDPALHYVLFALPTVTSTPESPARSRLRRECGGFLVAFVPGHHRRERADHRAARKNCGLFRFWPAPRRRAADISPRTTAEACKHVRRST